MYKAVVFLFLSMSLCAWSPVHAKDHDLTLSLDLGKSDVTTETLVSPLEIEVADGFKYGPRAVALSLSLGSSFDLFLRGQTDVAYRRSSWMRDEPSWGAESTSESSHIATVDSFDLGAGWTLTSANGRWSVSPRLAITHAQPDSQWTYASHDLYAQNGETWTYRDSSGATGKLWGGAAQVDLSARLNDHGSVNLRIGGRWLGGQMRYRQLNSTSYEYSSEPSESHTSGGFSSSRGAANAYSAELSVAWRILPRWQIEAGWLHRNWDVENLEVEVDTPILRLGVTL